MEKVQWGDDMAYAFSAHRFVLWMFGSWPLQSNTFYSYTRWALITVIELSLMVPAAVDVFVPHDTHQATLDNLLFLECGILSLAKNVFSRIHVNKLSTSIESAMIDWLTELPDKSSYQIMKQYARTGRLVTLAMFNSAYWYFCLSYLSIVFYPVAQLDLPINGSTIKRNFLISVSCFTEDMSDSVYLSIFVLQISQTFVVGMRLTVVDSFFFAIVMHVCGQLQVLSIKLRNLRRHHQTNSEYKKKLTSLVERHCQLIELVKNIEDTFSAIILLQILMSVILIALGGFRLIISISTKNNVEVVQNFILILFVVLQCSLYTYAGDVLQSCSEQVFFDVYNAPWYKFTSATSKDIQFIMMRANIPLQISGGKFITMSCKTLMCILKSAASYISFLSATMKD